MTLVVGGKPLIPPFSVDFYMYLCYYMNMVITRTAKIKLNITPEEILPTFREATKAFNYVCKVGYKDKDFNSVSLHHKTYQTVRTEYSLPSDIAVQMRMKAAEVLKPAIKKNRKCPQSDLCSIRYSARGYNVWFDRQETSFVTIKGRIKASFYLPDWFKQYISWRRKSAEMILRKGKVYLCIVFEKDVADFQPMDNVTILGIDRGINKVAVCSDNSFFNGNILKVAYRYQRLRKQLQKCGSKSAKRHLKKLASKENRYRRDVNHCISKHIVERLPENSIIVLEDLKYIRERIRANKKLRRKLHNWSFHELELFLEYKGTAKCIKVDHVDARYTSQKCSRCGHISRSNRKCQAIFKCVQCGFSLNADLNAARNIELNYRDAKSYPEGLSVNQPIVGTEEAKATGNCASV